MTMYHLKEQVSPGNWKVLARFTSMDSAQKVLYKMRNDCAIPLRFRIDAVKEHERWDFEVEELENSTLLSSVVTWVVTITGVSLLIYVALKLT
jgi:hypothetical protein